MNIALGTHGVTALIALILPETLGLSTDSYSEASVLDMNTSVHAVINIRQSSSATTASSIFRRIKAFLGWRRSNSRFLLGDWRVAFILSLYLVYMNVNALSSTILLQYVSKRYSITLGNASYFWSFEAVINIILFLTVLPAISTYLVQSRGYSILTRDVLLVRLSYLILAVGLLMVGLAPTLPTMTVGLFVLNCGTGGNLMMRLLLTYFVQPNDIVKMYSIISILETGSTAISEPLTAGLFNAGLGRGGGAWLGLPFLVCSVLFAIATWALWATHLAANGLEER